METNLCFPTWTITPFIALLLSIAVVPLAIPNWWDSNRNKLMLSAIVSATVLAVVVPCNPDL